MQNPNEDTEWNDALRKLNIIPPKEKEVTEDDIINLVEQTVQQKTSGKNLDEMTLDELNEKEDEIDEEEERLFEEYRSPLCSLVNQHMYNLAHKFPETKFLKSISSLCIPNYPDKNLPTIFVYFEGELKKQFVGPVALGGMNLKQEDIEWMLKQIGAVKSDMEEPPKHEIQDMMSKAVRDSVLNNDSDSDGY
ncbi:hypothetical protein C0Q70_07949 [Pomacea canaliculata]|uniref:Phosducin thioredoxin-like domain-containing protein n=1 Tax=Pomacea canaliculata TaxID=400727 RepID=A0A2T7PGL7_POMCA|nr:hypothetical protein C0Q70_07949 [Pomacea canaliculata]